MFVLDENIKVGRLTVWSGDSYGDVAKITTPAKGKATNNGRYTSGYDSQRRSKWYFDTGANILTWSRMSDGTLIMSRNSGVGVAPYPHGMTADSNLGTKYAKYAANNNDGSAGSYELWNYYQDVTINGTKVRLALFSPTIKGHYAKYIQPTASKNWDTEGGNRACTDYIGDVHVTNLNTMRMARQCSGMQGSKLTTVSGGDAGSSASNLGGGVEFRLIGTPRTTAPVITPDSRDLGTISDPINVTFAVAGAPTATISIDGQPAEALSVGVGSIGVDLSKWWDSLSLGAHSALIRAELGGVKTGAKLSFVKSTSTCAVTLKPHESVRRPSVVSIVDNCVVPGGAVITREVTNNALDESPTWETYVEGSQHSFSNKVKTAEQWGLAARIAIDNSGGSARASINTPVTMAVMYEGAE